MLVESRANYHYNEYDSDDHMAPRFTPETERPLPRLNISLFGTFNATLNEQVVRAFETEKARALLAYLAVEAARAQRREKLAGLLWPNLPEGHARQNLSQALYSLRVLLDDRHADEEGGSSQVQPILLVLRDTLQLNPHGKTWVDVHAFTCLLEFVGAPPPPQAG